ncbi:hypothetical protein JRQ81_007041, partial [Phrynocephalus forsythii]
KEQFALTHPSDWNIELDFQTGLHHMTLGSFFHDSSSTGMSTCTSSSKDDST